MFSIRDDVDWLPLPIVVVDDNRKNVERYVKTIIENEEFGGRHAVGFETLEQARRALLSATRPFGLILDHNMNGIQNEPNQEYGSALARDLRVSHPWGLALPIAYYSALCKQSEWVEISQEQGFLSPSMLFDKNQHRLSQIVEAIDSQFALAAPLFLAAMRTIRETDFDFSPWSVLLENER
jgi:hypothetical protein